MSFSHSSARIEYEDFVEEILNSILMEDDPVLDNEEIEPKAANEEEKEANGDDNDDDDDDDDDDDNDDEGDVEERYIPLTGQDKKIPSIPPSPKRKETD